MSTTPPENQAFADADVFITEGIDAELEAAADARAAAPGGDPLAGLAKRTRESLEAAFDSAALDAAARLEVETPAAWIRLKREMTAALKDAGSSLREWERAIAMQRRARRDEEKQARKVARPSDWLDDDESALPLERTRDGAVKLTAHNVATIIERDPRYAGKLWTNEMGNIPMFGDARLTDHDYANIARELSMPEPMGYGLAVWKGHVQAPVKACAAGARRHPVRDWLSSLKWDEQPRIDSLCARVLGNPGKVQAAMVRKWMVSAVARALGPGCQVDSMLVLQSEKQGIGKSSFFRELASVEWFTDAVKSLHHHHLEKAHEAWVIELSELDSVTKRFDVADLNGDLTRQVDMLHRKYAIEPERAPRAFVFCATVNEAGFLHDQNGARRYFIVPVSGFVNLDYVREHRAQLWAEAVAAYRAGEPWHFDRATAAAVDDAARAFVVADPWEHAIRPWLDGARGDVTTFRILSECIGMRPDKMQRADQTRVGLVMRRIGWANRRVRRGADRVNVFERRGS